MPQVQAYPNPAVNELRVLYSDAGGLEAQLQLCDVLGRVLRLAPLASGSPLMLDLRGLATGYYVLKISQGGQPLWQNKISIVK